MLSHSCSAFEHYLYAGSWLCVLRGISSSFQLSGWKQTSALTVAWWTLNPQVSAHFQLAGKKLILMRTGPPVPHRANLRYTWLSPCPESTTLPFTIICARLLCWGSQALRRNISKTQPSASSVKLMRRWWPWGSWLQSKLAVLSDQDKPQSLVIQSRVTAN